MTNTKNKILIVDDTKPIVVLLKRYCERADYETIEAYNGYEALKLLKTEKIDLILLDVNMPGIDGFAVAKSVKESERTRFIPIIMVTALSEINDRIKAFDIGVDDFLTKPINELLLVTKIRSLLKVKNDTDKLNQIRFNFISMIIHDIRAPLSNIIGFTEILENNEQDEERKKLLNITLQNSNRILELINDFLDFSKLDAGKFEIKKEPSLITVIMDSTLESFKLSIANKSIKLTTNYQDDLPFIDLDFRKIGQVNINLLSNAIKFSNEGGKISINCFMEKEFIVMEIEDNGIGIPEEDKENIFNPYFQSLGGKTSNEKGTGLGLASSKMIIEAHGGILSFESKLGSTKFYYKLPLHIDDSIKLS